MSDFKAEFNATGKSSAIKSETAIARRQLEKRAWWQFGGRDRAYVSVDEGYDIDSESSSLSEAEEVVKDSDNLFHNESAAEIYKPIEGYEGAHRFQPDAKWTVEEENHLRRKLDWRIALPACIMFFSLQLNRGNIVQAVGDNLLPELGMDTNDYNNGQTIFLVSFLFAELPSQLISKKLGPDVWIPIEILSWSIVAAAQAAITNRTGYFIIRSLLGLIMGGFIPDTILYLSYFYKNAELPRRLSWFWTAYQGTSVVGALLAYGILQLRGPNGLKSGWRYLFVIEGAITFTIGVGTYFYLPASPTQTARTSKWKGLLRPKEGWFSEREEVIMVTRILRDDPGKSTMHNRQGISVSDFWAAATDYDLWPVYLLGLSWLIPYTPPNAYITLTTRALGFNPFQSSLLTIPAYTIFIIQLLFWTWVSEKTNQRLFIGILSQLWAIPLLTALAVLPLTFANYNWAIWTITTLIIGHPYPHAILVALTSRNSGTVRTRTISASFYNISVQTANIIASQIYRKEDAPRYYTGNKVLLAITVYNIALFTGAKLYYHYKNEKRDKIWDSWTREERLNYLSTTKDQGNKRLDFRFAS